MLCNRGLCCHAVSVCLRVCLCVCVRHVRTFCRKELTYLRIFITVMQVAKPFWIFYTKRNGDISTGTLLTEASNAGKVGRNRDSEHISGFIACC